MAGAGKHVLRYLIRALCIWIILPSTVTKVYSGQDNTGPPTTQSQESIDHMQQLLDIVFSRRAKPITEQGVPTEKPEVNGQWQMDVAKLTEDAVFAVYRFQHRFSFNSQINLCVLDGTPIVPDGTLLGGGETPSTFYEVNDSFYVTESVEFNRCADQIGMRFEAGPLNPKGVALYHSHDRVLRQMCNWLRFLAMDDSDPNRAVEFLTFILHKQRQVLLDADSGRDLGPLAHEIGFFDRTFPFAVFNRISLNSDAKNEVREFFQTALVARRKLKAVNSSQAEQISRDEELLRRFTR